MRNPLDLEIIVEVRNLPRRLDRFVIALPLDAFAAEPFQPLPREREIPFETQSRERAVRQIKSRAELAKMIAAQVGAALAQLITKGDTVNGYAQEDEP